MLAMITRFRLYQYAPSSICAYIHAARITIRDIATSSGTIFFSTRARSAKAPTTTDTACQTTVICRLISANICRYISIRKVLRSSITFLRCPIVCPERIDIGKRGSEANIIAARGMRLEAAPVKVVAELSVVGEAIAIHGYHRHALSEPALSVRSTP